MDIFKKNPPLAMSGAISVARFPELALFSIMAREKLSRLAEGRLVF